MTDWANDPKFTEAQQAGFRARDAGFAKLCMQCLEGFNGHICPACREGGAGTTPVKAPHLFACRRCGVVRVGWPVEDPCNISIQDHGLNAVQCGGSYGPLEIESHV